MLIDETRNCKESSGRMRQFGAVVFDMDGTLIEPLLDFSAIRAELGVAAGEGILEAIAAMAPDAGARAHGRLLAHELAAARKARLMPDALATMAAIKSAGLKTALLTRNARAALAIVLEKFDLSFDLAWSREDGRIKPEPDGVLRACAKLGVGPDRTACIGDFYYDVVAANAAGAVSILLATDSLPPFADKADHVITCLAELPSLLGI